MSPILNAHAFKKGEQAYSRLFGLWPFDQGGDRLHICPNTKKNLSFFVYRFTNSDTIG